MTIILFLYVQQSLIDILLIAVECHHPNGVTQNSGTEAYAHCWEDWNRKLSKLNYVVNAELDNNKLKYRKLRLLPANFLNLAVEVYNQVRRYTALRENLTIRVDSTLLSS